MDTTRPLDSALLNKDVATKAVRRVEAAGSIRVAPGEAQPATELADTVRDTQRVLETARAEVEHSDERFLSALKDAITNGAFKVDLIALADKLVDDVLGEVAE